jgi:hypothetical protein
MQSAGTADNYQTALPITCSTALLPKTIHKINHGIPPIVWNPKVQHRMYKSAPLAFTGVSQRISVKTCLSLTYHLHQHRPSGLLPARSVTITLHKFLFCTRMHRGLFDDPNTDMRRLTTGIRSEKCVVRRFRRCTNEYLHKPR